MMRYGMVAAIGLVAAATASAGTFNQNGNILTTDQFNNRVLEISPSKQIVWSFGSGNPKLCNPGPASMIAPNDAERLAGGRTLLAGTGTSTCADNRVIVVDAKGNIVFQYGKAGVAGKGPDELNVPVFAIETPSHTFLIVDQANNRIIEVNKSHKILYEYAPTKAPGALNSPNSVELLDDGDLLVADEANNRVIEIDPQHANRLVMNFSTGLNTVAFASRLPYGITLVTDSGNNRIVALDRYDEVFWEYFTNKGPKSNANPNPTGAVLLRSGNVLIADQFNNRDIVISLDKRLIFQYGETNVVGNGPNQLNAPYSAVVIGDYTGQTPPPAVY